MSVRSRLKGIRDQAAHAVLAVPPARSLLNRAYNKCGRRFVVGFVRHFGNAAPGPFRWVCRYQTGPVFIPVSPAMPRSWNVALSPRYHEPQITAFFLKYIAAKRVGVFFDIGANYGMHSYPFLSAKFACVMFEPQAECVGFIKEVSNLNGFSPGIQDAILSDREGPVEFYTSESTWYSSVSKEAVVAQENAVATSVHAITLDAFCGASGVLPNIVKIDVEGHEVAVLRGARQTLALARPTCVVEVWPKPNARRAVFEIFAELNYVCCSLRTNGINRIASTDEMVNDSCEEFLFTSDAEVLAAIGI